MSLSVSATPSFIRAVKKLHARDQTMVDKTVAKIAANPFIGEEKKGDLSGVFVHKFKLNKQEILLAYQLRPTRATPHELVLLNLGSHENFYRELKR